MTSNLTHTGYNADLIIIGAGAAGLIAATTAGELGINALLLERRHRVGLKLLMCGNNRCNVSHDLEVQDMLRAYGQPVQDFLTPALTDFPPEVLRRWFARNGLATLIKNERIYPTTEKGDDVLHCFTDRLREMSVPLLLNCPFTDLKPLPEGGYQVDCERISLTARHVLMATGGVSYPKTGSVGDGHRVLQKLGLSVTPLRAGLAGVDIANPELSPADKCDLPQATVTLQTPTGFHAVTQGNILCDHGCLRGTAIFDATRLVARHQLQDVTFTLDLFPQLSLKALQSRLQGSGSLTALGLPLPLAQSLAPHGLRPDLAGHLKSFPLAVQGIRPLKEAIVTVGGVDQSEINPNTMEVKRFPGLFLAGELMDVDGPTGGFNLHAAFATARLAVKSIARSLGLKVPEERPPRGKGAGSRNAYRRATEREGRQNGEHLRHDERHAGEHRPSWNGEEPNDRHRTYRRPERQAEPPRGGQRRTPHSHCDAKPGNRWDNSDFEQKRTYQPKNRK